MYNSYGVSSTILDSSPKFVASGILDNCIGNTCNNWRNSIIFYIFEQKK